MDGLAGDLQAKYHKIASEYSKIRAHLPVLKKAILDEQTKNAEMRDVLKEREQSLRKAEQEMDSLSFRNQQLTRRVTVLQEELESMSKSKKGKGKTPALSETSATEVMGEELQKTITENARLQSLLHDKEESHKQDIEYLMQRIEHLEHELQHQQEYHKKALSTLEIEKTAAIVAASKSVGSAIAENSGMKTALQVESLKKSNIELTTHTRELTLQRLQLTTQLEDANRTISTHLPFLDSNDRELNELNVPRHDRGLQAHILHTVDAAAPHVEEIANALEKYHFCIGQRLLVLHESLSPLNLKFSEHLKQAGRILYLVKQGYVDFQHGLNPENWSFDTAPSLLALSRPLQTYSSYLQKLQPYINLSMEEDCIILNANEELHSASLEVVACSSDFNVQLRKICGYVNLIASQNRRQSQHPCSSQLRFLKELTAALKALHLTVQGLLCSYKVKFAHERESRNMSGVQPKEQDDGVLAALSLAVSSSVKMADIMEKYVTSPKKNSNGNMQAHPTVSVFHKRAAHYLASLQQDELPSIPYEEALRVQGEVRSGVESCKALKSQLLAVQEHAAQAEREREHWQQEYQFLHLRQGSVEASSAPATASVVSGTGLTCAVDSDGGKVTMSNLLGKLTAPFILTHEVEVREDQLKLYFRGRINELVSRSQISESKAITFISECAALKARLEDAAQSQRASEERAAKLSEELASTGQGYNSQLAVMSEHLANMNEKLALQRDTIDLLKSQTVQAKGSKKGKQK